MAVPTNLAEALDLLTFSGGDQITGQDVREVVTWLGSTRGIPDGEVFYPSADPAADTTAFEALLNDGKTVIVSGTLQLTRPVQVTASGWAILAILPGLATIQQHTSWSGTGNTNVENCLIRIKEVENATAATNVATTAPDGSPTMVVVSGTGFSGKYFKSLGISAASDYYAASTGTGCPSEELLKAASVATNTITHGLPQQLWHGVNTTTAPHKQMKILDSAVDGCRIEGIRFDVYQQGQAHAALPVVAVGLSFSFARNIEVKDCAFKGFVRDGIYMRGCRDGFIRMTNLGACNSRFYLFSCQNFDVESWDRLEVFERVNTRNGATWRSPYCWRSQCRGIRVRGAVYHVTGAPQEWGGVNCSVDNFWDDVDFSAGADTQIDDDVVVARRGLISDWGAGWVPIAEFGQGNSYKKRFGSNITTGPVAQAQPILGNRFDLYHAIVFVHDVYNYELVLHGSRKGYAGNNLSHPMLMAITCQDAYGKMDAHVTGTHHMIICTGFLNVHRGSLQHDPTAGEGIPALGNFIMLDECGTARPRWDYCAQNNAKNAFIFMNQMANNVADHIPVVKVFDIYPADQTSGNQGWRAENIYIGRFPDGSSTLITRCSIRARYDDQVENLIIESPLANAGDGGSQGGNVILLSDDFSLAGTKRHVAIVLGGPGAVAPVVVGASVNPGQVVMSDLAGKAVPHTDGASFAASYARLVGRVIRRQTSVNGITQLG